MAPGSRQTAMAETNGPEQVTNAQVTNAQVTNAQVTNAQAAGERGTAGRVPADMPVLHRRYQINHRAHLAGFDAPSAEAYAVSDLHNPDRPNFALLCQPDLPLRSNAISRLRKSAPPGVLPLIDSGVIFWPPAGRRLSVVVMRRPLGGTLADLVADPAQPRLSEYEVPRRIIAPMLRGLRSLETIGLTHRAIRPANLPFLDDQRSELVLGECVTAPPGFGQPLLFEPVERAMAMLAGRGDGSIADDVYALGVTVALVASGREAVADLTDDQIIQAKLAHGSYALLCEHQRIPLSLVEPLRGMLADDPQQRWTLDNLDSWMGGQRQLTRPKRQETRPSAPFPFADGAFLTLRELARAFSLAPPAAAETIRSGDLDAWLAQRYKDADLAAAVAEVRATTANQRDNVFGSDEFLVTRIVQLLDPAGPVRYRGFDFMPDGLGPAFAFAWLRQNNRQTPAEALALGLADTAARLAGPVIGSLRRKHIDELGRFIRQRDIGAGPERCLYAANPGLSCQSPLVAHAHVVEGDALVLALEAAADKTADQGPPMDRHIAAFIASRYETGVAPFLAGLADADDVRRTVAILGLYAMLQRTHSLTALPGLAAWIGRSLGPVVASFRSRSTRGMVEDQVPKLIARGRLSELYDLLSNRRRRDADRAGLNAATAEYETAERRIIDMESSAAQRRAQGMLAGQRAAAWIATMVAFTVTSLSFSLRVW